MRSAAGWKAGDLLRVLAAIFLLTVFAAAIIAKDGSPGATLQRSVRSLAAALQVYDTEASRDQCLTNVRNIARVVQLYLGDYGSLPPEEHDPQVIAYFRKHDPQMVVCGRATKANPYLRWPVVLEKYVPSRQCWNCPSARLGVTGLWIVPGPDWLSYLQKNEGKWGRETGVGPCTTAWPAGWGGTVTDSLAQGTTATSVGVPGSTGAFRQSIGYAAAHELTRAQVADPAWFVVCGDANGETIWSPLVLAYAEGCQLATRAEASGCGADWANCPWTQSCGVPESEYRRFQQDAAFRKRYTRHLGGSNVGFLDGHAAWMPADAIVANSPTSRDENRGKLRGIKCLCEGLPKE